LVRGDVGVGARGGEGERVGDVRENLVAGDELPQAVGWVAV